MSHSQNKQALKSGGWYIVGSFLLKGIGFLTTPIFTRIMSQEDIGDFTNILTWLGIVAVVSTLSLRSSIPIAKFDYKEDYDDYIGSAVVLGTILPILFFIIMFPFRSLIVSYVNAPMFMFYLGFVYIVFNQTIEIFQAKSQVLFQYKASLAISILTALSSALLSIIFVMLFSKPLNGRLIGFFIPFIIIGIFLDVQLLRSTKKIRMSYWKYALKISVPIVFHLLSGYVLSFSDRIMIYSFDGSRAAGIYAVTYSCATMLYFLVSSANNAWAPWTLAQLDEGNEVQLKKASKIYALIFGVCMIGLELIGPEILYILGGKQYMEGIWIIPPVITGVVFQFMYIFYTNVEAFYKKQKMVAIGTVIAAGTNVLLNWIFIPIYGYIAAAYTTLISYAVLFVVHYIFVRFLNKTYIYDSKFNYSYLIMAIGIMFLSILLYSHTIIRYLTIVILVFLVLATLFMNREQITESIKKRSLDPIAGLLIEHNLL